MNGSDDRQLLPEIPDDLTELASDELVKLDEEVRAAVALIQADDQAFLDAVSAEQTLAAYRRGVETIEAIAAELTSRAEAIEHALQAKQDLAARLEAVPTPSLPEPKTQDETPEPTEQPTASTEDAHSESAADPAASLPTPTSDRIVVSEPEPEVALVASGGLHIPAGTPLDESTLADAILRAARNMGTPPRGSRYQVTVAHADYRHRFPDERSLSAHDLAGNAERIRAVVPAHTGWGEYVPEPHALTAAGNVLCAPLTPVYSMPNFATTSRPVRDALPGFRADRGGVNVPTATTIGDITTAISVITQEDEVAGGTFATKSCQDMDCPSYTQTAITTISHCRRYGNLNDRAWPEKIAHENAITLAAHARSAEGYLLGRIRAQSVQVTSGAETLSALSYLVDALVKSRFGIVGRLRMAPEATFRALLPWFVPELLALDTVQTVDGNRFRTTADLVAYLRSYRIEPVFYQDTPLDPTTGDPVGTSQLPDASQGAGALEALPDQIQWALYPEGAFIFVDGGELNLGVVRDSTLNETNEFEVFGETFENVARIAPLQACYWETTDLCANGQFPPAGTARACD